MALHAPSPTADTRQRASSQEGVLVGRTFVEIRAAAGCAVAGGLLDMMSLRIGCATLVKHDDHEHFGDAGRESGYSFRSQHWSKWPPPANFGPNLRPSWAMLGLQSQSRRRVRLAGTVRKRLGVWSTSVAKCVVKWNAHIGRGRRDRRHWPAVLASLHARQLCVERRVAMRSGGAHTGRMRVRTCPRQPRMSCRDIARLAVAVLSQGPFPRANLRIERSCQPQPWGRMHPSRAS